MSAFDIRGFRQRKKRERLALEATYAQGKKAALAYFKMGATMGADYGVAPRGDEQSHGTERIPYAPVDRPQQDPAMPQWLWNLFGENREAPGAVDGYGTETIG